jgi:hypothetical protein
MGDDTRPSRKVISPRMRTFWKILTILLSVLLAVCFLTGFSMYWWPGIPPSPRPAEGRVINNSVLMCSPQHNVSQNVAVFGFDAEPFEATPVPSRVQVRGDSRCAGQQSHMPICLKPIFSILEPEPVAAGHVRPINGKPQVVGWVPFSNRLLDVAHIKVASALRADSVALHYATVGNRQTNVHQDGLAGLYPVD